MLRVDRETGVILTGGLSISARIGVAIKLAEHLASPQSAILALKAAQKSLNRGLEDRRNQVVHGSRVFDPNDPAVDLVETHRGKIKGIQRQSNQDLASLSAELATVAATLHKELLDAEIFNTPCFKPAPIIALKTYTNLSESGSQPES